VSVTLATGALEDGVAVSQPVTLLNSTAHFANYFTTIHRLALCPPQHFNNI
jgi:hypothetical protein